MTNPPAAITVPRSKGWVIGRVLGAPLILQPLWFLVAAVLTAILVPLVRSALPGVAPGWTILVAATFVVVLFLSVLAHELAHAWVATRLGQRVHEIVLSALGGHTSFTRGGLGPGGSALVAFAGPLVNLVLGGALLAAAQPLLAGSGFTQRAVGVLVAATASANLIVAAFNLVPGLPLDGGQLLAALVWQVSGRRHTGTVAAAWVGRALAAGLVAWVVLVPLATGRRPELFTLVWMFLIAATVWSGASAALRQAVTERRAEALTVPGVGRRAVGLRAGSSAADVVHVAGSPTPGSGGTEVVLVADDGAPVAYVDRAALAAVPPGTLATTPAWSVAAPVRPGATIDAQLTGPALLSALVSAFRVQPVVVAVRGREVVAILVDGEVARSLR